MEKPEHIIWTLNIGNAKISALYTDTKRLEIRTVNPLRHITQFPDFDNPEIYMRFSLSLLLKLRYPFYFINDKEMTINCLSGKLELLSKQGNILIKAINGGYLEIYLNTQKIGEIMNDRNWKNNQYHYSVYLDVSLEYDKVCYLFIATFCYFIRSVNEGIIVGPPFWKEHEGKRSKPYFIPFYKW
jgi:hypothetical protein